MVRELKQIVPMCTRMCQRIRFIAYVIHNSPFSHELHHLHEDVSSMYTMLQQLEQEMRSKYSPHKSSTHTQQEDEALKYLDPYLLTTEFLTQHSSYVRNRKRKRYTDTTYTQQYIESTHEQCTLNSTVTPLHQP